MWAMYGIWPGQALGASFNWPVAADDMTEKPMRVSHRFRARDQARPVSFTASTGFRVTTMADDTTKTAPGDAARISLADDYELAFWAKRFGIAAELKRSG
jgi:Protein of unknown function (DUF3606)